MTDAEMLERLNQLYGDIHKTQSHWQEQVAQVLRLCINHAPKQEALPIETQPKPKIALRRTR